MVTIYELRQDDFKRRVEEAKVEAAKERPDGIAIIIHLLSALVQDKATELATLVANDNG